MNTVQESSLGKLRYLKRKLVLSEKTIRRNSIVENCNGFFFLINIFHEHTIQAHRKLVLSNKR